MKHVLELVDAISICVYASTIEIRVAPRGEHRSLHVNFLGQANWKNKAKTKSSQTLVKSTVLENVKVGVAHSSDRNLIWPWSLSRFGLFPCVKWQLNLSWLSLITDTAIVRRHNYCRAGADRKMEFYSNSERFPASENSFPPLWEFMEADDKLSVLRVRLTVTVTDLQSPRDRLPVRVNDKRHWTLEG